jgi:transcriptional regulator with XRE-family HTH domain
MTLDIKSAIKAHDLEVRTIASRMGITPTALSQHINGKMYKGKRVAPNPSVEILQRIANAIGCDIVELFSSPSGSGISGFIKIDGVIHEVHSIEDIRKLINN